ncbi:class I SAM-dependent methyltransferase [Robiginitalea sediminis]|uniref:class I SAM-dependent methyltransferase n=1 Tax=Robiginitalea sediminis TaxID=1982593 RepID=UPI000B4A90E2|nr:class I SAM-dependent methyltransferase [Robiginitalea sediminis]
MDLLGKALTDYLDGRQDATLLSHSSFGDTDAVPAAYFFRGFDQMPVLEQKALRLAKGRVLDIGCGAGSHCLWLQEKGLPCTGLDISSGALEVARKRGVKNLHLGPIQNFEVGKFDTLLLLMNGIGLAGRLKALPALLAHLTGLLAPEGQILLDSSDIIYMYEEDSDGGVWIPGDLDYYGEVRYRWEYQGHKGSEFPWLFADFQSLSEAAVSVGLEAELLAEGPHYDYLARLVPASYQSH